MVTKSPEACSLLKQLWTRLLVTDGVTDQLAQLTIQYLYNDRVSKSFVEARALKWSKMKSTSSILPDMDSFKLPDIHTSSV